MKIVIVVLLILVVISLFTGLFFMYSDKGQSKRTVIALTVRVALSLTIFGIVIAAHFLGWLPGSK
jgi:preprotein translocase subunit Sec61beta